MEKARSLARRQQPPSLPRSSVQGTFCVGLCAAKSVPHSATLAENAPLPVANTRVEWMIHFANNGAGRLLVGIVHLEGDRIVATPGEHGTAEARDMERSSLPAATSRRYAAQP